MKNLSRLLFAFLVIVAFFSACIIWFSSLWLQFFVEELIYGATYIPATALGIFYSSSMILLAIVALSFSVYFLIVLNRKVDGVSVMDKLAYGAEEAKSVMEKKRADRAEAKRQKQLARQQKRLEKLQAEMDELKKDE